MNDTEKLHKAVFDRAEKELSPEDYKAYRKQIIHAQKNVNYKDIQREMRDDEFAFENGKKASDAIKNLIIKNIALNHSPIVIIAALQKNLQDSLRALAIAQNTPIDNIREIMDAFKSNVLDSILEERKNFMKYGAEGLDV